jgi:hypothetical protein
MTNIPLCLVLFCFVLCCLHRLFSIIESENVSHFHEIFRSFERTDNQNKTERKKERKKKKRKRTKTKKKKKN